jgi:hypothetical protein
MMVLTELIEPEIVPLPPFGGLVESTGMNQVTRESANALTVGRSWRQPRPIGKTS